MNDDELALNEPVGEEASDSTPPVEEQKAPEEETVPEATAEESETETGENSKKGATARIRELNARAKSAEEKTRSLEKQIAELTNPGGFQGQSASVPHFDPQEPIVRDGEEIDVNELNRRISEREQRLLQQADARAELRSRQNEAVTRINSEAHQAINEYPELDSDSESFDPELSETITEATIAYIKSNPYTASPKKFVDKLMRPYKRAVTKEVGKASENIARQVSQAALRPTGVSTSGKKDDKDLSVEELEQKYGVVY